MNLPVQLAFEHDYEVEYIDESPETPVDNQFWFPGPSKRGGQDGLHLRVKSISGKEWIGVFPFGEGGAFGIYSPEIELITSTKIEGACEDCGKDVRFAVETASGNVIHLERAN